MVGVLVGAAVGAEVGFAVGAAVTCAVGLIVGLGVVGAALGAGDGRGDGFDVGAEDCGLLDVGSPVVVVVVMVVGYFEPIEFLMSTVVFVDVVRSEIVGIGAVGAVEGDAVG